MNQGHPNPLDGIQPAVKSALTKAYKEQSKSRVVRVADQITLPGVKKAPKKRIAAILEPADEEVEKDEGEGKALDESEEENSSDAEELGMLCVSSFYYYSFYITWLLLKFLFLCHALEGTTKGEKLQLELQSLNSKGRSSYAISMLLLFGFFVIYPFK